jgi:hypothetical protein
MRSRFNKYIFSFIDSKQKQWCLYAILFFLLISLDDYGTYTLRIPPLDQLKVTEGVLKVKRVTSRKGGSGGDIVSLLTNANNSFQSIVFRCRIGTIVKTECISINDSRFYDRTRLSDRSFTVKSNTSKNIRQAKVWWYEANVFGPLLDNRLLQLDVAGERIISYEEQKEKYLKQKKNHMYLPTIFLAISFLVFGILQLVNSSNPSFKRNA